MSGIEVKELRGITIRLIVTLVIGTMTISGSVMGTYFSLIAHMEADKVESIKLIDSERHAREMGELQMKEMRIRLDALEVKVDRMNEKKFPETTGI